MPNARAYLAFIAATAFGGCFTPNVPNGKLHCSNDGKCPSGFHCAVDQTCWKNGQDPQAPDMATAGPGRGHTAAAQVAGGVSASSEHYKIVTTTGQAPGGNGKTSSSSFTSKGGVVGATQNQ